MLKKNIYYIMLGQNVLFLNPNIVALFNRFTTSSQLSNGVAYKNTWLDVKLKINLGSNVAKTIQAYRV